MRRTGRVLRVDAERDATEATVVELAEYVKEQCLGIALPAPRPPHAERADVPASVSVRLVPRDRSNLVAVPDDEPKAEIEVRIRAVPLPPLLERRRVMLPVILERLVQRVVECAYVVLGDGVDVEARRIGSLCELDRHAEEVPDVAVPSREKENAAPVVR